MLSWKINSELPAMERKYAPGGLWYPYTAIDAAAILSVRDLHDRYYRLESLDDGLLGFEICMRSRGL